MTRVYSPRHPSLFRPSFVELHATLARSHVIHLSLDIGVLGCVPPPPYDAYVCTASATVCQTLVSEFGDIP
jgi:hypothetical protein